jgi:hypothetical protein
MTKSPGAGTVPSSAKHVVTTDSLMSTPSSSRTFIHRNSYAPADTAT